MAIPNQDQILEEPKAPAVDDKPINLPDPDYTPPAIMTSKLAKNKVAGHLNFLKQLTEK